MLIEIEWPRLKTFFRDSLLAAGLPPTEAATMAEIYVRATSRGVGHHDVYDFPGRLKDLHEGRINLRPCITLVAAFGGCESYNGDNGPGEVCAAFATDRAVELAGEHGSRSARSMIEAVRKVPIEHATCFG